MIEHCGHSHGPEPAELKDADWFKRGMVAAVAAGLRPCSGAILVLVFALAQGIFLIRRRGHLRDVVRASRLRSRRSQCSPCSANRCRALADGSDGRPRRTHAARHRGARLRLIVIGLRTRLLLFGYLASERLLPF
jgi:nickel/cobalt exporter